MSQKDRRFNLPRRVVDRRGFGSVSANHLVWIRKEERQNNTNQGEKQESDLQQHA
jgi:hypothetical protein